MTLSPVLIVFSHLRWSFVYQRPQHLLSRLAGRWRVLFVEEPVHAPGPPRLAVSEPLPGLKVLVPHTPATVPGFHDDQLALLEPLLDEYLLSEDIQVAVAWLYTPMALPLVKAVQPQCLVYDCMDELAAFKDAPRQLRQRESALFKRAAVVLTGGPSLFEAKRHLHPNAHCLPSSVDAAHYAPANLAPDSPAARDVKALQDHLPQPRLGYFGVIDERLDIELVGRLADAHPEWQVVMVGPVVKIDPAALPRRPNIHWLGMQSYERLPHLLAGWQIGLLPFALNESTRFISPTKTLEYMAGEKPVVSTAVHDVSVLYGNAVTVAESRDAFVQACEAVLTENAAARSRRAMEMLATVSMHSWARSADTVHRLLTAALVEAQPVAATDELALVARGRALPAVPATVAAPRVAVGGGAPA